MPTHVALLRGVNLGPARRVPMAELRRALQEAGFGDVRTLLASGNVLVDDDGAPETVARRVHDAIAEAFGLDVGVIVRSGTDLAGVVERNPLADVATEPLKRLQVVFFEAPPPPAARQAASAAAAGDEQVVFAGREAYSWHPDGVQGSKLARLLAGERLGLATARNWNTVTRLRELAS
jgi:uncharacterized protein (DUF1697 family)